jgi:hypothetical protein
MVPFMINCSRFHRIIPPNMMRSPSVSKFISFCTLRTKKSARFLPKRFAWTLTKWIKSRNWELLRAQLRDPWSWFIHDGVFLFLIVKHDFFSIQLSKAHLIFFRNEFIFIFLHLFQIKTWLDVQRLIRWCWFLNVDLSWGLRVVVSWSLPSVNS